MFTTECHIWVVILAIKYRIVVRVRNSQKVHVGSSALVLVSGMGFLDIQWVQIDTKGLNT